jgi:mannose-6-phosphate isomerase-like protein (cupin superfamily)
MGNSNKKPFRIDLENKTKNNNFYRYVVYTSNNTQLVLMSIKPNEEIGNEIHNNLDQFIKIEQGLGNVIYNQDTEHEVVQLLSNGIAIIIPAGLWHNIKNIGDEPLKLYTIYSHPEHTDQLVQENKFYRKYIKYKNKYLRKNIF